MFDIQSTNTFRNSSKTYTIPKTQRFQVSNVSQNHSLYDIPKSNKSIHGTSLGFGERIDISYLTGKGNPGPDNYYPQPSWLKKFPMTIKNKIPDNHIQEKAKIPSPGNYNIITKSSTLPTTLKFRHNLYYDDEIKQKGHCISPQTYFPDIQCIKPNRYSSIKFTTNPRIANEMSKDQKSFPGIGQYNLPSVFDLTRKYKPCIN